MSVSDGGKRGGAFTQRRAHPGDLSTLSPAASVPMSTNPSFVGSGQEGDGRRASQAAEGSNSHAQEAGDERPPRAASAGVLHLQRATPYGAPAADAAPSSRRDTHRAALRNGRPWALWALAGVAVIIAVVAVAVAVSGGGDSDSSRAASASGDAGAQMMEAKLLALEMQLNATRQATEALRVENERLWQKNRELETRVFNMQLIAGPQGPEGPEGPRGRRGIPGNGTATCV